MFVMLSAVAGKSPNRRDRCGGWATAGSSAREWSMLVIELARNVERG
jgi:hypothetical protein